MFTVYIENHTTNGIEYEALWTTDERNYANDWAEMRNKNNEEKGVYYCVCKTEDKWF